MARNGLLIHITDEDEKWAVEQDRWNCAIVRSIQRQIPEAIYVVADAKDIAFSLPDDGKDGTRYHFDVTPEIVNHVIKPFDTERKIDPEYRTFTVVARSAEPMKHQKRDDRIKQRTQSREYRRNRTSSPVVRSTNRFISESVQQHETGASEGSTS